MKKEIGQFPVYLVKMSLMAIGGALVILFLQLLIFSNDGIVNYFLDIKRLSFLSYYFNLHILLSIIVAPLVETYLMIALLNLFARMGGNDMQICLASAFFGQHCMALKGGLQYCRLHGYFFGFRNQRLNARWVRIYHFSRHG